MRYALTLRPFKTSIQFWYSSIDMGLCLEIKLINLLSTNRINMSRQIMNKVQSTYEYMLQYAMLQKRTQKLFFYFIFSFIQFK